MDKCPHGVEKADPKPLTFDVIPCPCCGHWKGIGVMGNGSCDDCKIGGIAIFGREPYHNPHQID